MSSVHTVNIIICVCHSHAPCHRWCAILPPLWAFSVCAILLPPQHHQFQETTEQFKLYCWLVIIQHLNGWKLRGVDGASYYKAGWFAFLPLTFKLFGHCLVSRVMGDGDLIYWRLGYWILKMGQHNLSLFFLLLCFDILLILLFTTKAKLGRLLCAMVAFLRMATWYPLLQYQNQLLYCGWGWRGGYWGGKGMTQR